MPDSPVPEARIHTLLFIAVVTMAMGQTLVFALLPLIGREVGLAELQIGIIITASSAVYALATRVWGRRSDRWGRRRVILIGLAGYTVGTLIFTSLLWVALIVARCLQSSVMAGTMPASSAYISDITDADGRTAAIARVGAANSTGTILGPALGGLLAGISLLAPLYFAAVMTFISLLLVLLLLPESPGSKGHGAQSGTGHLQYGDHRYRHYLLIATVMLTAFSVVQQTLGFYFQDVLQLNSQQAARQVGFALMSAATMSLIAQGVLVQKLKWPAWRLIQGGLLALLAGSAALAVGSSAIWLFAGVGLCGLGIGLSYPGCVAAATLTVAGKEQGGLAGLTTSLPAIGSIIGPVLGAGLYEASPHWPYVCNLLILLPLMVYAWRQSRQPRSPAD